MSHLCAQSLLNTLIQVRSADLPRRLENGQKLGDGIYFTWDSIGGSVDMSTSRDDDTLFKTTAKVTGTPDWFNLCLILRLGQFLPGDVLGLTLDWKCSQTGQPQMLVRSSARQGQFDDTKWQEALPWDAKRRVVTLMHTVEDADGLTGHDKYHTIIIPLPTEDFTLEMFDLQFFVSPRARGLRSAPIRLSKSV
ncbi:hypothetical protein [Shimia marina]|uniref:Uncharacterized protein n=1 Tax=Shimia marina TaxID=321267 RepID=A0A0P1EM82_9RHOB|nr:hypothetical protein [Shimia marina]CUH51512.1 hypothetical protein SHM7688_00949 [Shimia marina]SFD47311.1 hypothetical protein SAMN04488037_101158 [Shimia marina]